MSKRSLSLADKLNARFTPDQDILEAFSMVSTSHSPCRFDSPKDFAASLVEGSLLNVSVIGSRALSIPQGEYMVWMTNSGHTMLVPTSEKRGNGEVYENSTDGYEVQTRDLMANWNRIERVIAENGPPMGPQQGGNQNNLQEPPEGEEGDPDEGQAGEFRSTIDASTVDRTPMMRAMQDRGFTVTSLAAEVGVDPPAISRILRTPKDVQGDPGGRNPSMGLASQICNVLRIDPTAAFPDIFNQNEKYRARQQPGNDGSGSHSHGRSDNIAPGMSESIKLDQSIMLLEANNNYNTLCNLIAESGRSFNEFWYRIFIPTLLRSTARTTPASLTESLITEWPWSKPQAAPQANTPSPFAVPGSAPGFSPSQQGYDKSVQKMNAAILPKIQQAFKKSMTTLKADLQKVQMQAGADPKIAPHAWKAADQFFNNVVKAGMAWTPKWNAAQKGSSPGYADAYSKASQEFQNMGGPQGAGMSGGTPGIQGAPNPSQENTPDFGGDPLNTNPQDAMAAMNSSGQVAPQPQGTQPAGNRSRVQSMPGAAFANGGVAPKPMFNPQQFGGFMGPGKKPAQGPAAPQQPSGLGGASDPQSRLRDLMGYGENE